MIVGIDGSNLRSGGAYSHISRMLAAARPEQHGIDELRMWTTAEMLERLPQQALAKVTAIHEPILDAGLLRRVWWQRTRLRELARDCDVLFVPGGTHFAGFSPMVTMSRNMLPFEWTELRRYGVSITSLRLLLLRVSQDRTFRRADGMIFLTSYARDVVSRLVPLTRHVAVIPHGVDERFRAEPRPQRALAACSEAAPLRLLYVSMIDLYKHQWNVAEAVARLRRSGLPLAMDFVGPAYPRALRRFEATLDRVDPERRFLRYRGPMPFEQLHELREQADVFVFASSCENMPNILLEGMASGFPIACGRRGPMPGILGDAGVYFDPEDVDDIERAVRRLVEDADLRTRCAAAAYERALAFSWERCARETLDFVVEVAGGVRR